MVAVASTTSRKAATVVGLMSGSAEKRGSDGDASEAGDQDGKVTHR
jgi:hypothetical protein